MATSSDSNRLPKWLFIIAIISLVLCVPSLILIVIAKSFQTFGDHQELSTEVCINANVLDPKFLETKEGQKFFNGRKEDAQEKYCMRDANDLTNFLLSYKESAQSSGDVQRISNLIASKEKTTNAFSVHVPLISSIPLTKPDIAPQFDNTSKYPLHLDTENIGVTGEIVDNFVVTPMGIIIKYTGMYFVYSNVLFDPHSAVKCADYATQTWRHDVMKISPNDRQSSGILLTSLHICCDGCAQEKKTSYTGGVFFLATGDHLFVEVSAIGLNRFEKAASFFGLSMLGNSE